MKVKADTKEDCIICEQGIAGVLITEIMAVILHLVIWSKGAFRP